MQIFNHTGHRALWCWLSENPSLRKDDFFKDKDEKPCNLCYACEAATACSNCPIVWDSPTGSCDNSSYDKYVNARRDKNYTKVSQYAKIISNLPLNSMYEVI